METVTIPINEVQFIRVHESKGVHRWVAFDRNHVLIGHRRLNRYQVLEQWLRKYGPFQKDYVQDGKFDLTSAQEFIDDYQFRERLRGTNANQETTQRKDRLQPTP